MKPPRPLPPSKPCGPSRDSRDSTAVALGALHINTEKIVIFAFDFLLITDIADNETLRVGPTPKMPGQELENPLGESFISIAQF